MRLQDLLDDLDRPSSFFGHHERCAVTRVARRVAALYEMFPHPPKIRCGACLNSEGLHATAAADMLCCASAEYLARYLFGKGER